jgi:hypothetical protein
VECEAYSSGVAPADGTGVAQEDRTGVSPKDRTGVNPACPPGGSKEKSNLPEGHDSFSSVKSTDENVCVNLRPSVYPVKFRRTIYLGRLRETEKLPSFLRGYLLNRRQHYATI